MLKTPSLYLVLLCLVACLYWPTHSSASGKLQNPDLSPLASGARGRDAVRSEAPPAPNLLPPPCPQIIWDNGPFNNVDGLASEENTLVTNARTADDFVLPSAAAISTITFDIYVSPASYTGAVDIYADSGGSGPVNALPLATYTSTTFNVVGSGFGLEIRRYTVTLSPPLNLAAGRYWVSGYVIGTGSGRGYLCTSNGATPDPGQTGYFRSFDFTGVPDWIPATSFHGALRDFAFTVCGESRPNVNNQVQLLIYPSGNAALLGCSGYTNRLILTGQLTNIGSNTLSGIAIRVRGLGFPDLTNPNNVITATPNPHRLATADNFTACTTGGLAGALQTTINGKSPVGSNTPIPTLNPGQTTVLFFRIHCPTTQLPIRFLVDVLAVVGGNGTLTERDTMTARRVVRTVEVEVRRSPQGKLIAEVLGERPTPTSAAAAPVQLRATQEGKR